MDARLYVDDRCYCVNLGDQNVDDRCYCVNLGDQNVDDRCYCVNLGAMMGVRNRN